MAKVRRRVWDNDPIDIERARHRRPLPGWLLPVGLLAAMTVLIIVAVLLDAR